MQVITGGKGSGKTTTLIQLAANTGGYIVCHSRDEASRIAQIADELGYDISFPITHDEFIRGDYHAPGTSDLLIDNVELLLQSVARVKITAITLTT